jgi:hypothetical protein
MRRDTRSLERQFLFPWLCSAAVITFIRLLHATDIGYDITLQIQAGQHLLEGKGLSVYWPTADDVAKPLTLEVLTQFSSGYSLYTAALAFLGINEAILVKVAGAPVTLLGWLGWARLAFIYMSSGIREGGIWRFVGIWIAIVSPLLFTSQWGGTDIFLWAAIPWVLELIMRPSQAREHPAVRYDLCAGILIGLCVLMRYASVFVAAYAALVIVWHCRQQPARAVRRLFALTAGMLPAIVLQRYINSLAGPNPFFVPGSITIGWDQLATAGGRALESLITLVLANQEIFFWVPGRLQLWIDTAYDPATLVLAGISFIVLPVVFAFVHRLRLAEWSDDVRTTAAGLLIVLPVFLWVCGLFGTFNYLRQWRYYDSLRPLAVFIAFFFAASKAGNADARIRILAMSGRVYLLAFMLATAVEVAFIFVPHPSGVPWRRTVLGAEPRPWPSFRLTYEFSEARAFVLGLMQADPKAILITNREQWFYADPEADRSRIMRWEPCVSLRTTHVSGPVRLLIFERDFNESAAQVRWPDQPSPRFACWPELPVKLVQRFPDEQLRVLQADVAQGVRLDFKHLRN